MAALLSTLRDSQEIVKELEDPGVDPSLIKQQIEAAEVGLMQYVLSIKLSAKLCISNGFLDRKQIALP